MPILKSEVDLLELLREQEARLLETLKRREMESVLDKFELKSVQMKRSCTLTKIAFYGDIPMDRIRDMVVTKSGVFMKGACNAGPVLIHSGDSKGTSRKSIRKTGSR